MKGCREGRSCEACGARERVMLETGQSTGIGRVRDARLSERRRRLKVVGANARFSVDRVAGRAGARCVPDRHDSFSTRDASPTAVQRLASAASVASPLHAGVGRRVEARRATRESDNGDRTVMVLRFGYAQLVLCRALRLTRYPECCRGAMVGARGTERDCHGDSRKRADVREAVWGGARNRRR